MNQLFDTYKSFELNDIFSQINNKYAVKIHISTALTAIFKLNE